MTGRLSRILGALDRMLSFALGAILISIFCLNLYQVGGRYLFGVGAVWIPDLTRLLFIWMVFLGTALMHQRKRHLVIDVLLLKCPEPARRTIEALIALGMLGLAGVMAAVGWRIMQIRMDIPYTGLEIPTGYAYLAVPVAAALIALTSLATLWEWTRAGTCRVDAGAR
jgi:TRAP-type C4-dicarboxylate transport system permease small subunit